MHKWSYSLGVWVVMVLYATPLLVAWTQWATVDHLPYFICVVMGSVVSLGLWRLQKRIPHRPKFDRLWVFAICWAPCLAMALGLAANVHFDDSPGVGHDARFLGYQRSHKGPSSARFSSWREPDAEETLTCNGGRREMYCLRLEPGAPVVVTTHRGAFGWEWVEKVVPR